MSSESVNQTEARVNQAALSSSSEKRSDEPVAEAPAKAETTPPPAAKPAAQEPAVKNPVATRPAATKPASKKPSVRLKLLRTVNHPNHRYRYLRALGQFVSLGILFAVPFLGIARFDAWGGNHWLLMEQAPMKHALAGVIVGIVAMYIVTFMVNLIAGRLFCGWGCPVAQVTRWGEAASVAKTKPGHSQWDRLRPELYGAMFSAVFVMSFMAWWVDLRVLVQGNLTELAIAWSVLAVGVAGAYLHGKYWRWGFCKTLCPIGNYYSIVAPAKHYGVHFRNEEKSCIECNACDRVCPVDLNPRDLMQPALDRPGLAVSDAPQRNHCLECGDCIQACEHMIAASKSDGPVPLLLGFHGGPQRIDPTDPDPGDGDTAAQEADREQAISA